MKTIASIALLIALLLFACYFATATYVGKYIEKQGFSNVSFIGFDHQACGELRGYLFSANNQTGNVYVVACSNKLYNGEWSLVVRNP